MAMAIAVDSNRVGDGTFVTRSFPDISKNAGLIGLCTVPYERADPMDLGWHVADFLAFKKLLGGYLHPKAQTWLAHCDIGQLIKARPELYAHGKDRRIFHPGELTDDIDIETSAGELARKFVNIINKTGKNVKKLKYELVVIICGPTTLEQDVFFGTPNHQPRVTSTQMRIAMGLDGCNLRTIVITPALFSAGWQINPSFCEQATFAPRADRTHFLARQFGAIFARPITEKILGWGCPMLDLTKVDTNKKAHERFPGPIGRSAEKDALMVTLHQTLAARQMSSHSDHSFSFDVANDEWEKLIGPRKGSTLVRLKQTWEELDIAHATLNFDRGLHFLGGIFGGTKTSQVAHIKQLIQDSLITWQGVWANEFGKLTKEKFQRFLDNDFPDEIDCHEMFMVMEHRSTLLVMADTIIRCLGLLSPNGERCRDYADIAAQSGEAGEGFARMCSNTPKVFLPPGMGINGYGYIHVPHYRESHYVGAALGHVCSDRASLDTAMGHIRNRKYISATYCIPCPSLTIIKVLDEVQDLQLKLLFESPELRVACKAWLKSIKMPIVPESRLNASETNENNQVTKNTKLKSAIRTVGTGSSDLGDLIAFPKETQEQTRVPPAQVESTPDTTSGEKSSDKNPTETSDELDIRQKSTAYLKGDIKYYTLDDLSVALRKCPDLIAALIDRMQKDGASK